MRKSWKSIKNGENRQKMVKIDKKWCYLHLRWCYLRRWLGCSIDFVFSAKKFAENPKKNAVIYHRYHPLFACMIISSSNNSIVLPKSYFETWGVPLNQTKAFLASASPLRVGNIKAYSRWGWVWTLQVDKNKTNKWGWVWTTCGQAARLVTQQLRQVQPSKESVYNW